ncbi:hypothetical protein AB0N14_27735 [Streptomyces sp. NPDC051104]|uniref:hypothetical protein n=1 Tax=Streptomyces sp. NPDC051104 TaxID=3155044 RepID=UPI00342E6835
MAAWPGRPAVPTVRLAPAVWVVFFPSTFLAATAPEAAAPVVLPDADCCTAVFFTTMAAAPSHM